METVIVTTRTDLEEVVDKALEEALHKHLPETIRRATTKAYLTKQELMDLTGWSSRQVEYKKSQREIPFVRRGRLILFPTADIYTYLDEGFVPKKMKREGD